MKKLLYIDACIRLEKSRTRRLANAMLNILSEKYDIYTVEIGIKDLTPINHTLYNARQNGIHPLEAEKWAHILSDADVVFIAAPFWDMSFPSVLKVFFEQVSIPGITFKDTPNGTEGICRAKRMIYVTTRGMKIETGSQYEQATPYLKSLCYLWGIERFDCISACGMDVISEKERGKALSDAEKRGIIFCEEL